MGIHVVLTTIYCQSVETGAVALHDAGARLDLHLDAPDLPHLVVGGDVHVVGPVAEERHLHHHELVPRCEVQVDALAAVVDVHHVDRPLLLARRLKLPPEQFDDLHLILGVVRFEDSLQHA